MGEGAPGTEVAGDSYLDARQRQLDELAEKRLQVIYRDYQNDINNYEMLQKGTSIDLPTLVVIVVETCDMVLQVMSPRVTEEQISKTARVLEEADISEEKRDVIHREIGKFRESMKVVPRSPRATQHRPPLHMEYILC